MTHVVVLGANGQVGNELCPILAMNGMVRVTAVTRSVFSQALLHKLGVACVVEDDANLRKLLAQSDVLVDLAMPADKNIADLRRRIVDRAGMLHRYLRPGATMVYASTMSVFRLDPAVPRFTIYGSTKMLGERTHLRLGPKSDHPVYVLRLGQVHGVMQSCSSGLVQSIRGKTRVEVPEMLSYTVFVSSIAEAIERIAAGGVSAGTYTLISDPAWSWREVVEWWAGETGVRVDIGSYRLEAPRPVLARAFQAIKSAFMVWADRHRDRLSTWLWYVHPRIVERLIAQRYSQTARLHIRAYQEQQISRPIGQVQPVPGQRFPGLSDSRTTMPPRHRALSTALTNLTS